MENADEVDNLLRHSRYRWSGQGTDNRRRQNKSQKTQIEQIIHQNTIDADEIDEELDNTEKTQITDTDGVSHGRCKSADNLPRHSSYRQSR